MNKIGIAKIFNFHLFLLRLSLKSYLKSLEKTSQNICYLFFLLLKLYMVIRTLFSDKLFSSIIILQTNNLIYSLLKKKIINICPSN